MFFKAEPEDDYLPPSPPVQHTDDLSGLKQLAEISLATAGGHPFNYHFLSSLLYPNIQLTPSSTPSPPPAHLSPTPTDLPGYLSSGVNSISVPPPQESPLDLRVVSRKLEYPPVLDQRRDSIGTDSGESVESESYYSEEERKPAYSCEECGKGYSSSSNLARHRQTHKPDQAMKNCPHCAKEYTSPAALAMHMRTHTQGCKCPFCGKSFSRPWLLQGHIRTHTGEKPFSCHLCNKAFADKSNLRAHVQTHSSDKPFSCGKCGKAFALKSYLSKHEESSCLKNEKPVQKRMKSEDMETDSPSLALPPCSASSELSLTRLLASPSLLPQSQISEATLQALKMAVFASKN